MSKKLIHVAAAVIRNKSGQILIAKRPDDKHQGGLWEFPGGKVEPGEPVKMALSRELEEELGIEVQQCEPLIKVPHHYTDKSVLLDVYEVTEFTGQAWGKEGQPIKWVEPSELDNFEFPAANHPILNACALPEAWFITPATNHLVSEILQQINRAYQLGARGVMLRAHQLDDHSFQSLYQKLKPVCQEKGIFLSVNRDCDIANEMGVQALHLSSGELTKLKERGEFQGRWLSASCHSPVELEMAVSKGVDFVTLSPVCPTHSHPEVEPMGWSEFKVIAESYPLPVYALGGVSVGDVVLARKSGAQGIAAISAWLEG